MTDYKELIAAFRRGESWDDAADTVEHLVGIIELAGKQEVAYYTRQQFGKEREICEKPFTTDWERLYTHPDYESARRIKELEAELNRRTAFGGKEPPDLDLIRNSPRQFVDMETVELLADYSMCLELKVARLESELSALRKDAERYRWLRDQNPSKRDGWAIGMFDAFGVDAWRMATKDLDAAIDAAMGEK